VHVSQARVCTSSGAELDGQAAKKAYSKAERFETTAKVPSRAHTHAHATHESSQFVACRHVPHGSTSTHATRTTGAG
jgi:hypothetical protein